MSKRNNKHQIEESEVDMTPMLDIVFIMLIFFIVTTSFVKEEGMLVNRPEASKSPKNNDPIILVKINETGLITFDGKLVDIERLPARIENFLAKSQTQSAVVIPSYETSHEDVVKVLDQIKTFDHLTISIGK
ncbi:biopolymer transporter ExbD [Pseudocolwellia sp. AS88]|uniref:ExbD/TolR family protein n=1 Tax=Pseudocolwellia sp. AS88 TaxID=3063958 RepID=UPI0026F21EC9|nr:biopolymer transporter ExbD [Pseudocolwellia sp. AS88]MDO7086692.1 biopolymer transporter ExbD [Pseudocolwellia sp. AS88]